MRPVLLLATMASVTMALVACTQRQLTEIPVGDGYGPAGGGIPASDGTSSGGSASGSTPPTTPTSNPSQPPASNEAGAAEDAGGIVEGFDAGAQGDATGAAGYDAGNGDDSGVTSQLLALCVSQINEFRAQNGAPPYTESADLEAYAAKAVASDAHNLQRHSYFYATGGGDGVAATEDELDGDQVDPGGSAEQTLDEGLQQDEQAQGNAYDNLVTDQLSAAGCGFAQDAAGNWWIDIALH